MNFKTSYLAFEISSRPNSNVGNYKIVNFPLYTLDQSLFNVRFQPSKTRVMSLDHDRLISMMVFNTSAYCMH